MIGYPEHEWNVWEFQHQNVPNGFWKDPQNRHSFFEWLGKKIGINNLDDWYEHLNSKTISENGGSGLLAVFHGSAVHALLATYPNHNWIVWNFSNVPNNFWKEERNQKEFMEWLGKKCGVNHMEDWYNVLNGQVLQEHRGRLLLSLYGNSPFNVLKAIYPNHKWYPWLFSSAPHQFWHKRENQREFFEWLGKKIGIVHWTDWYQHLDAKVIIENGGAGLLAKYNNSPYHTLATVLSEYDWIPWKFKTIPADYWNDLKNQRKFMEWLGNELGVKQMDDWYNVLSNKTITSNGASSLLERYGNSSFLLIKTVYPDHEWLPWKFQTAPQKFWQDEKNQREFMEWLGKQLGVKTMDDWYGLLTVDILSQYGGGSLLNMYNRSPYAVLCKLYPNHSWQPWKFQQTPHKVWKDATTMNEFMSELSEKFQIGTLSDWYRISQKQLVDSKAFNMIKRSGGLIKVLQQLYPDYHWEHHRFYDKAKRSSQREMVQVLKCIFPSCGMYTMLIFLPVAYHVIFIATQQIEIIEDCIHRSITIPHSTRPLQLDAFIPSLSLAFEYQGEQHYHTVGIFSSTEHCRFLDQEKRVVCKQNNITLVEVPYWWDRKKQSLMATILSARPDLEQIILANHVHSSRIMTAHSMINAWQPIPKDKSRGKKLDKTDLHLSEKQ